MPQRFSDEQQVKQETRSRSADVMSVSLSLCLSVLTVIYMQGSPKRNK